MFPCSVTAIAGMFSFRAWSSTSSMRQAPSRRENSVCRCRWTKSDTDQAPRTKNQGLISLPFNGRGRLRADVVHDAVDAPNLVDDARRDALEQIVRQTRPVGGHPVLAFDRANRRRVLIGALIAHDADALHRQQHGETLPQFRVPACPLDFLGNHRVGAPEQRQSLRRYLAENSNGEAGPRKGLADDELFLESERPAHRADLILEQLTQRLDELHP